MSPLALRYCIVRTTAARVVSDACSDEPCGAALKRSVLATRHGEVKNPCPLMISRAPNEALYVPQ